MHALRDALHLPARYSHASSTAARLLVVAVATTPIPLPPHTRRQFVDLFFYFILFLISPCMCTYVYIYKIRSIYIYIHIECPRRIECPINDKFFNQFRIDFSLTKMSWHQQLPSYKRLKYRASPSTYPSYINSNTT